MFKLHHATRLRGAASPRGGRGAERSRASSFPGRPPGAGVSSQTRHGGRLLPQGEAGRPAARGEGPPSGLRGDPPRAGGAGWAIPPAAETRAPPASPRTLARAPRLARGAKFGGPRGNRLDSPGFSAAPLVVTAALGPRSGVGHRARPGRGF
nr:PREDICTED: collagen alpha-1(I) chain-like [Bos indicus]